MFCQGYYITYLLNEIFLKKNNNNNKKTNKEK